jgi:hypothetical protein
LHERLLRKLSETVTNCIYFALPKSLHERPGISIT